MNENIFEITDLHFSYLKDQRQSSKSPDVKTLDNFELFVPALNIRRGKLTAILGRSGSGKTTLLSLLALLRKPLQGNLTLTLLTKSGEYQACDLEQLWHSASAEIIRANYMGFALQGGELLSYLSLVENVEFVLKLLKTKSSRSRALNCLEAFYSKDEEINLNNKPAQVSHGQKHRSAVARALVHEPQIVFADEPTGNLDVENSRKVLSMLKEYIGTLSSRSVILVTHDIYNAVDFADEIIVISNGTIVSQQPVSDAERSAKDKFIGFLENEISKSRK
jgi:ABC-type lipoprotein export system ATPase subunit